MEAASKGLSHFDFDIDNVLTKNDHVTAILDFGDIECMPLVVCLGYTLWDVLCEEGGSPALVARYLQKYQAVRQLNQSVCYTPSLDKCSSLIYNRTVKYGTIMRR
jgi:Ser/Thr protein kinase RdoA (MazF antagonist)